MHAPDPRARAQGAVRRPPPYSTIAFDCDSTLSTIEGIEELAHSATSEVRAELLRLTQRAMSGEVPLEEVFAQRLALVRPTRAAVEGIAARYCATAVPGARNVIAALRALGKRVIVLSGGLRDAVAPFARWLGVEEVYAVPAEYDEDGAWLRHDPGAPLARSNGKPQLLRALCPDGDVALVGDGATDAEAGPACARFVAYGGVIPRSAVLARGDAVTVERDLAAVLPALLSAAELARLADDPAHATLVARAHDLERARRPALWIPGPTEVRPELLRECARPMFGHRSREMDEVLARIDAHLPTLFGLEPDTTSHVAVHSCTASGLMEAALRGAVDDRGGKVLCLVNGSFSQRFVEMAAGLGLEHAVVARPPGEAFEVDELARALEEHAPVAVVTWSVSETSTGAATPPARLAEALASHPDTLSIGDFVTWLGGAPIDFDAHRLDFALAGTQKALALPPGLGVCAVSQRYLERARRAPRRGWFLDPVRIVEAHAERKPPMTPTISLHLALAAQLEDIAAGDLERALATLPGEALGVHPGPGAAAFAARYARHAAMRDRVRAWAPTVGLEPVPRAEVASPTVACLRAAPGVAVDLAALVRALSEAGFQVGGGYGALKATTFRIGHMGDHSRAELERLLMAATRALALAAR
ncbi:MAG: HAD-IB family phosphatase [Planctomycetota bacterium]